MSLFIFQKVIWLILDITYVMAKKDKSPQPKAKGHIDQPLGFSYIGKFWPLVLKQDESE